ncbi:phosphate acetyltransferase, partial [Nitrospinae bacterium AH_259_B05_G02_I21]|nr:phosphate acetyltransferase [Nitrospinae bacterium AH_259_B05_G02_I21]
MTILESIRTRARALSRRVVMPEGMEERTVRAAAQVASEGIAQPVLLGGESAIAEAAERIGVSLDGVEIADPATAPQREAFEERLSQLLESKGVEPSQARRMAAEPLYFGALLVDAGECDAMV